MVVGDHSSGAGRHNAEKLSTWRYARGSSRPSGARGGRHTLRHEQQRALPMATRRKRIHDPDASAWTGYTLQENLIGIRPTDWSNVTKTVQNDGTIKTLRVDPTDGSHFYRLIGP